MKTSDQSRLQSPLTVLVNEFNDLFAGERNRQAGWLRTANVRRRLQPFQQQPGGALCNCCSAGRVVGKLTVIHEVGQSIVIAE